MNEWMYEWINVWMNEWVNEPINQSVNAGNWKHEILKIINASMIEIYVSDIVFFIPNYESTPELYI